MLEICPIFIRPQRKRTKRVERRDVKIVVLVHRVVHLADLNLFSVLDQRFLQDICKDLIFRPKLMFETARFEYLATFLVLAEKLCLANLIGDQSLLTFSFVIHILFGHFPFVLELRFKVAVKIVDLEKVVTPIRILNEIADEVAYHAIFTRIDIHLLEHLVDCVDRIDCRWIGGWHAFDNVCILTVIGVDCEKGV